MDINKMNLDLPAWAKEKVAVSDPDFFSVRRSQRRGRVEIHLPDLKKLKGWAKLNGWPAPRSGFKEAFVSRMFESHDGYTLALTDSGVELYVPIKEHILSKEEVEKFDLYYAERSELGQPVGWGSLVGELRAMPILG